MNPHDRLFAALAVLAFLLALIFIREDTAARLDRIEQAIQNQQTTVLYEAQPTPEKE